ncbi:DUF5133 domain-containing protein [Streptomyces sp. NPDC006173]|uniref:DUF5133 domain-containing protein n=1 Tax=Streptomyces sp. NPDC006173 TaxID=3155349 RepID=UPI0033DF70F8
MLMPLPSALRPLLTEYETLLAATTADDAASPSQRLQDLEYTLCVSTGTCDITQALQSARSYLATSAGTPAPTDAKPGRERRAAGATTGTAITATVYHNEIGDLQRGSDAHPGLRRTAAPLANTAQDSGR